MPASMFFYPIRRWVAISTLIVLLSKEAFAASSNITTTASATLTSAGTIEFASAVVHAAVIANEQNQLTTVPAIALPPNITDHDALSQLAAGMPPIQILGNDYNMASEDISYFLAALVPPSSTDRNSTVETVSRRQGAHRVMIVGDSMTQGQQGDFTWRYRIWQWFQDNGVNVDLVGPYVGTVPPPPANPGVPSPPPLASAPSPSPAPPVTDGGYATAAGSFDSDHFSVWGRAVAVDKGLIQGVLTDNPADIILFMLGFNDMGWFYSDASGTLASVETFIANARAANPNIAIALANVPQRSFIGGRQDLVDNTNIYNGLLPTAILEWTTDQSPIYLVELEENYDCAPAGCPAGYDGLHPNEMGEYQIAHAFSLTLYNDFHLGNGPLVIPADIPARPLPVPSNFQVSASPQGVTATWDPVYGAYSYDVQNSIQGISLDFSAGSVASNRWDSHWSLDGFVYTVQVRAAAGNRYGDWTGSQSATAHPETAPGPNNIVVTPTADGAQITWDPPTGPFTDSITEYNVIFWDIDSCNFISGAAFLNSPGQITGQTAGHRIFVAVETWNANGEGFPQVVNEVIPGAGTPAQPSGVVVNSFDPTSVQVTWDAVDGAAAYGLWIRDVNDPSSALTRQNGSASVACLNDYFLFPGTWNYEFCISALNGNEESGHDNCVVAPSPTATNDPGPSCPAPPAWCPNGPGSGSPPDGGTTIPSVGSGGSPTGGAGSSTLVTTTLPGGAVVTTSVPLTPSVITATEPGGSVVTTVTQVPVSESAVVSTLPNGDTTTILTIPPEQTGSETLITSTLPGGSIITTSVPVTGSAITTTLPDGSILTTTTEIPVSQSPPEQTGSETLVTTTLSGGVILTTSVPVIQSQITTTGADGSPTTIVTNIPESETPIVTTLPNGQTTTVLTTPPAPPVDTGVVTSTMTTIPPGVSVQDFTDFPITTNVWLTTTGSDSSTTVVPVLLPCPTCEPVIVWDVPEIPDVEFDWPSLPELPHFHLPCVKIFGIHVSGDCPSDSGPPPVNDEPPESPEASSQPSSSQSCTSTRTVTDYFVSCTSINPSSTSCTTTSSEITSDCSVTASATTTTGSPLCSTYTDYDDDQGSDPPLTTGTDSHGAPITTGPGWSGFNPTNIGAPVTTPFISCTHYDEDPDQGVTQPYCVCSGSTFAESTDTSVTPANSCAYTTLPAATTTAPIQTETITYSAQCSVCTYVGMSATCDSITDCTPSPTTTTPTSTAPTAAPSPTTGDLCVPDDPEWGCSQDNTNILYCYCGQSGDNCVWTSLGQCENGAATCHLQDTDGNCGLGFGACC